MYTDFSVRGFRGLGQLELDRLTLVTVITGRNGVGKSSLLEAMFLLGCGPTAGVNALTILRPMRQLPSVTLQSDGRINAPWSPFFLVGQPKSDIAIGGTWNGGTASVRMVRESATAEVLIAGPEAGGPTTARSTAVHVVVNDGSAATVAYRTAATVDQGAQIRLVTEPDAPAPIAPVRIVKGPGAVDVPEAFSQARRLGRDAALLEALRAVDPRIQGIELLVGDGGNALHARIEAGTLLPFTSLGDGINSVLTCLLSMIATEGGLVLVDELEKGLHHSVFGDVWRALVLFARSTNTQLVVTTHSDECITGAVDALRDELGLLTLVRLRRTDGDLVRDAERPVAAVTYTGERVYDAVDLAVEVR